MSRIAAFSWRGVIALAGTVATGACLPLPIPHQEQITPPIVGELRSNGGQPIPAAAVALTGSADDSLCTRATVHLVTDEQGRFQAPAIRQRKAVFWFVPGLDRADQASYWMCSGTFDSTGAPLYRARAYVDGFASKDSVACLEWTWGLPRVTCSAAYARRFLRRGRWEDETGTGTYQLILVEDDAWGIASRAYLQWLEPGGLDSQAVRQTMPLPVDPAVSAVEAPWFVHEGGHWYVKIATTRQNVWGRRQWVTFELGPPGRIRRVANR